VIVYFFEYFPEQKTIPQKREQGDITEEDAYSIIQQTGSAEDVLVLIDKIQEYNSEELLDKSVKLIQELEEINDLGSLGEILTEKVLDVALPDTSKQNNQETLQEPIDCAKMCPN